MAGLKYDEFKVDPSLLSWDLIGIELDRSKLLDRIASYLHAYLNKPIPFLFDARGNLELLRDRYGYEPLAEALGYGEVKYGRNNYKEGFGGDPNRFMRAYLRHFIKYKRGKTHDGEARLGFPLGNTHLGAMMFCLLLIEQELNIKTDINGCL